MFKTKFYFFLILIALGGFFLRFIDYDRIPPFGETKDEFMYPWAGMSLLQTGVSRSWSFFSAYPAGQNITYWGESFRLVSPWNEKPPLYSLITGITVLLNGQTEFNQVRLSTIRVLPLFFSFATIILAGLLGKNIFHAKIGLLAALLYSTIPTIVLANRLSLTENLLTPLILGTLWVSINSNHFVTHWKPWILGLSCFFILLTKQIGLAVPVTLLVYFIPSKNWKIIGAVFLGTMIGGSINLLMGAFTDWQLYLTVMREFTAAHTLGLPETLYTLFRIPGIGHKESIFLDGAMLAGFILLFAAPFWLHEQEHKFAKWLIWFPFIYFTLLALLEGGQTWYGWHLFPLYPFIVLLIAKVLFDLYEKPECTQSLFFFLTLGVSSVRFWLLLHTDNLFHWPHILASMLLFGSISFLVKNHHYRTSALLLAFFLFIFVNIYTIMHLGIIYPSRIQPVSYTNRSSICENF